MADRDEEILRELRRMRDGQLTCVLLQNPTLFAAGGQLIQAKSLGPSTNLTTVTSAVQAIQNDDRSPVVAFIRADGPNGGQSIGLFVSDSPDRCTVDRALISRYGSSPEVALVLKPGQKLFMGVITNTAVMVRVLQLPWRAAAILDVEADVPRNCR